MCRAWCFRIVTWAVSCVFASAAFAEGSWTTWTAADGLPGNTILALACTPDGTIWAGTDSGVARYDGARWTAVTMADGLANDRVRAIAAAPDGSVWFGTHGGVSRFREGVWTTFTPRDEENDYTARHFETLAVAPDGSLYAGGMWVLFRFDGAEWSCVIRDTVDRVVLAPDGTGWAGSMGNLYRLNGGVWASGTYDGYLENPCLPLTVNQDGSVWFARYMTITDMLDIQWLGNGVSLYESGEWRDRTEEAGMTPGTRVHTAVTDSHGTVWFGTSRGLVRYDGASWETVFADGLPEGEVYVVAVDSSGAVWAGTKAGVTRYSGPATGVVAETEFPRAFGPLRAAPNPFNPSTTISFEIPVPGRAVLTVCDITGRRVRTLLSGQVSAGTHTVLWDGRDEHGAAAASGVYFSRLEYDRRVTAGKMTLIR